MVSSNFSPVFSNTDQVLNHRLPAVLTYLLLAISRNKMAAKRFINQDPEYDPIPMEIQEKRMKCIERDARNATVKKIESILRAHFGAEINNKAKEVDTIDDILYEARQMIDRLRAQVVMKYYCEAGSSKDAKPDETAVPSIHPTVKENLIGKSPKYVHPSSDSSTVKTEVQALSSTPVTDSMVQNSTSISTTEKSSEVANSKSDASKDDEIPSRMPRMKTKFTVIVGNVSKFLPAHLRDEDDQFTHKWMVYVRGDKDSPCLDGIVKKVCFLLHSSYRPNDIVEVCNPPFHLVKRGWGEFQIRVQLHFKDPRNKPVDLLHPLRLDKTFTGLQTLGAETVFELMLYKPEDKAALKSNAIHSSPGPSLIQQAVPVNVVNKITPAIPNPTSTQNEVVKNNLVVTNMILPPEKVKKEKDELPSSSNTPCIASLSKSSISPLKNMEITKSHQSMQSPSKAAPSSFVDKPKSPIIMSKQSPLSKPLRPINPAAKNQITNGVGTFIKCTDSQGRILLVPQTSLICMSSVNNNAVVKPFHVTQTVVQSQCTSNAELGKSILHGVPSSPVSSNAKLPSYVLKVIPTVQSRPNQVLLIPVSEGTQKTQSQAATPSYVTNNASSATGKSFQLGSTNTVITPPSPVKKTKQLLHWEQVMEGLRIESYGSFVELLKKMMKVFPLISQDYDPASIPFCAPSVEVFQSWNIGKQRAAEWQRAGMVRSAILKLLKIQQNSCVKSEDVWSRREIMVWCRKNGYTPPLRGKSSSGPVDAHVGPALNEICTVTDGKSVTSSLESQNSLLEVTEEDDEEIDIIYVNTEDEVKKKKKQTPNRCFRDSLPPSSPSVYFVKESAAEIGIKLTPLEVEPSIFLPIVEEMIHAACKEFASDLVRASLMQGYHRVGGKSSPEEITVQDVFCALQNTSTFDFLTNKHLGVLQEPLDQS